MARKPSAAKLAKGLLRAAHKAEALANRLRTLGDDRHANAVAAAASALANAGYATEAKVATPE
jgi:hypothetical protein